MHPIDDLMQDHRTIEKALAALEWATSPRSVDFYEQAADFIAHFADQYHHEKEEQLLFPALAAHGLPAESGPIGCMLHDHEAGRTHLGRMRMAIALGDRSAAAQAGADYAALIRAHIAKEDGVLFEMAREILPVEVIDELALKFEAVGSRTPRRDHYRQLADEMLESVG